jgi:alkanesulfonate monooxygenase SsuD/methylene tetrahydromethanopterin reductase-like flavin-dependent oxidoreductase (luciferase family)
VAFNEHHCSPYGLMNSPNLLEAAAIQRTKQIKLLIYGNLLPLHEPLRLAEEIAMLDCMSKGRIISGFARGIPREYQVHNVPLADSRSRFDEAYEILLRAWTEEVFSYEGRFWKYKDVSIWPRPVQRPYPPIWMPLTGSKESIEFAGAHNIPITPGVASTALGLQEDIIGYYSKCLAQHGHRLSPDHLSISANIYVADSKEQAVRETWSALPVLQSYPVLSRQLHGNQQAEGRRLHQSIGIGLCASGEPAGGRAGAIRFSRPDLRDRGATGAEHAMGQCRRSDRQTDRAGRAPRRQYTAGQLKSRRDAS